MTTLSQSSARSNLLAGCAALMLLSGCGSDASPGDDGGGGNSAARKRIFVTSVAYDGALGGLSGADEKCNTVAAGAVLGGSWKAWLSDAETNAIDRIVDVGPWYLVDGRTKVFNNKANMITAPIVPISMDQNGAAVGGWRVWTGTAPGGVGTAANLTGTGFCGCDSEQAADWTSSSSDCCDATLCHEGNSGVVGALNETGNNWTQAGLADCSGVASLYCIEQ